MPELYFFCDENITPQVQELLKQFGHKVSSIKSIGKFGLTNGEIIKLITPMQEILVTIDKRILKNYKGSHFGILILDIHPARDLFILPILEKFLQQLNQAPIEWKNKIWKLTEEGIKERDS